MAQQYSEVDNPLRTVGFHFHKWTRWEQYNQSGTSYGWSMKPNPVGVPYTERRQKRHCVICRKEQDELI